MTNPIHTVTIVGANGTMGRNVSAIFASFGNAKVYLVSKTEEKSGGGVPKIVSSVRSDSIRDNLISADYTKLRQCISASDLIFECVTENWEVKAEIHELIAKSLENDEDKIICSGTSGISITQIADIYPEKYRKNIFGMHFFNPPYQMTLCECIPTSYTDRMTFELVKKYAKNILYRTVVEVKDSPAFLANRIGFQFINKALQYADRYKNNGGIDYIDAILGPFTGRAMAPLATADFVGLDVHAAIVDNLFNSTNDYAKKTFLLPDFAKTLIQNGYLGKKTGCGFYKKETENSSKTKADLVYDIFSGQYREKIDYRFPFSEQMYEHLKVGEYQLAFKSLTLNYSQEAQICLSFLLNYIIYAISTVKIIAGELNAADKAMGSGFNWCPPLALVQALSTVGDIKALMRERLEQKMLQQVDIDELFSNIPMSDYDYRIYFKARLK